MSDEVLVENEVVENQVTENTVVEDTIPADMVEVNGQRYQVKKLHAKKIARIANLFANSLIKGNKQLRDMKAPDSTNILLGVLAALTEDDLVRLAAVLIDSDEQFASDNFDLLWVTDALAKQIAISNLRAVVENFTSLLSQIQ